MGFITDCTIVIALVEYLTSEEAGQPLGRRFAWPVNMIVNGQAGGKAALANGKSSSNGHVNGTAKANGNGNAKKEL